MYSNNGGLSAGSSSGLEVNHGDDKPEDRRYFQERTRDTREQRRRRNIKLDGDEVLVSLAADCSSRAAHQPPARAHRVRMMGQLTRGCQEGIPGRKQDVEILSFFFFPASSRGFTDPGHVQRIQERVKEGEQGEKGSSNQVRNAGNNRAGCEMQGDKGLARWKISPSFVAAAAGSRRIELQRRDVTLLRACPRNLPACRSSSYALWRGDPREWRALRSAGMEVAQGVVW